MAYPKMHEMVWFGGDWWWFPTANISLDSAQYEWRNNRVCLLQPDGSAVAGILFVGEAATE